MLSSVHAPGVQRFSPSCSLEFGSQWVPAKACWTGGFLLAWAVVQEAPEPTGSHYVLRVFTARWKKKMLGMPSAPFKIFCLSSLAACLEYTCAEDSSRMGGEGEPWLLRQPLPVCKHPAHVDLAWHKASKSNWIKLCAFYIPHFCSLYFSWKLSTFNFILLSQCHLQ